MSELDPFFNDEALVKGITKDSRRLRPYGTVCVMPKYTSAIVNELNNTISRTFLTTILIFVYQSSSIYNTSILRLQ